MKSSVAQFIVRFLKECGVRHLFGVSGHSIFDITDALYGDPEIRFVQALHEGPAAYMAAAYAKAKRNLGACLASSGAGATNLLTGTAYSHKESIPLVALSSDVRSREAGRGASSWHEIPQREMFEPVTKMSVTLKAESALDSLLEAVRQATTGRKGPVYIGIPRDVQNVEITFPEPPWLPEPPSPPAPDSAAVKRAAEELKQAAAPIIVAGGGVYWARAEEELKKLAELLGAPFATTPSHKGLLSEEHPLSLSLSLGVLGFGSFPFANSFCLKSDVVLAVGATFSEALTLGYGNKVIPEGARIVHVDIDQHEIGKIYPVRHAVVGDAKTVLRVLINRLKGAEIRKSSDRLERLGREKLRSHAYGAEAPIDQWHVYRALMEGMSGETIVVGAGGTTELVRRFIAPAYAYHSGDFRAIGSGVATSIGLGLAFPAGRSPA
jgi:acetolactate synthase I/II/III large subunit